ncbi:MAG: hypothetical protein ACREOZ_00715 [Gloeomargaritales cyanobacterium]
MCRRAFRLSYQVFDKLLRKIAPYLQNNDVQARNSSGLVIALEIRLASALDGLLVVIL